MARIPLSVLSEVVLRAETLSAEGFGANLRDLLVELDLHGVVYAGDHATENQTTVRGDHYP